MNIQKFIAHLERCAREIKEGGGDPDKAQVCIEAIDDSGHIYYEDRVNFFIDSRNDIGISPVNK